jgi:hypothetical protein
MVSWIPPWVILVLHVSSSQSWKKDNLRSNLTDGILGRVPEWSCRKALRSGNQWWKSIMIKHVKETMISCKLLLSMNLKEFEISLGKSIPLP